jgi:predicted nucleic acid-binding protein
LALTLPDPDDPPFLEVAAAANADALVTGNVRHYRPVAGTHEVTVVSPRELVDLLGRG